MAVLMAWIADLEEQLLISGVQNFSCPVCTAVYHNLAEADCCGVHTGEVTISELKEVWRMFPSASLYQSKQEVKKLGKGLSGMIEEPCWAGLSVDPYVFIRQDILHGLHKFIWDHPGKWLKKLIGKEEMDCHFIAQPPIHTQRFTGGISKISQASGWEHHAYQKLMLPVIFGHEKVDAKVIDAIWSVLDFAYMAQYPLLSESNLNEMKDLLSSFNQSKEIFISNGSQESGHFHIPKLHALWHFVDNIHSGGIPDNCSTETPESLHIQMCKDPYGASNHHDYDKQILNYLNIQDHLSMCYAYEDYRERERIKVSKPFFVCCKVI